MTPNAESGPQVVKGCFFHLFEFMLNGAIVNANEVKEDLNAVRQDVQQLAAITDNAAATVRALASLAGSSIQALPERQLVLIGRGRSDAQV